MASFKAEELPWHIGVHDAHCHPLEHPSSFENVATMKTRTVTVMAVRLQDQLILDDMARKYGPEDTNLTDDTKLIPGFGWHPWFSHWLYDDTQAPWSDDKQVSHYQEVLTPPPNEDFAQNLEKPVPLSTTLDQLRRHLTSHPLGMVGEVGIDKAFRLPEPWKEGEEAAYFSANPGRTPGGRCRRPLSNHRVDMKHQKVILSAQLRIAGEMERAVSVHGVQAHGVLHDVFKELWQGHEKVKIGKKKAKKMPGNESNVESTLDEKQSPKPYPPRVCLHSFSGALDAIKPYYTAKIPSEIYVTFSWLNNFASSDTATARAEEVIRWVPETSLLVESDLHKVGDQADDLMEKMMRRICEIRGWSLEYGVTRIGKNWWRFVTGKDREDNVPDTKQLKI